MTVLFLHYIQQGFRLSHSKRSFDQCTRLRLSVGLLTGVVSIVMSLRVDRMYDQRLTWTEKLQDKDSPEYLQLEYESSNAVSIFLQTIIDL